MLEIGAALELIGQTINSPIRERERERERNDRAGQEFIVNSSDALIALLLCALCVSLILFTVVA
jgi:hypothetical protein